MPGTIKTWHELPLLPHDDGRHVRRAEGVSSALSLARYEAPELTLMPPAGAPRKPRPRRAAIGVGGGSKLGRTTAGPVVGPAVLPDGLGGDVVVGGRGVSCGHVSSDRAGLEALDDQPDAE